MYLAAQLLEGGGLSFTPSSAPYLFQWVLRTPLGTAPGRVFDMNDRLGEWTARELYRSGALIPSAPYYLTASVRQDPVTGERQYVGLYGVGAALGAIPVLTAVRAAVGDLRSNPAALWYGAKLAATLFVAASAALLFLLVRRFLPRGPALALALLYGLATPVWSVSSQALWQHAPDEFLLTLGALALASARGSARAAALAGAAFAAAAACRPTSALFAVSAALWLLWVDRRSFWTFCAGGLPLALLLGAYNLYFLGSPLRFGQGEAAAVALAKTGSRDLWRPHVATALAGLFLSPARGLFVFSPFLLLSVPGAVLVLRRDEYSDLRPLVVGAGLVLCVDVAWFDWWGGWSYGWRRLVDLAPVLVLMLVPVIPALNRFRWGRLLFGAAVAWAVLLQFVGAFAYSEDAWDARRAWRVTRPSGEEVLLLEESAAQDEVAAGVLRVEPLALDVDLPQHRARLWSLGGGPIPYYLSRFPEARRARERSVERWIASWQMTPPPAH